MTEIYAGGGLESMKKNLIVIAAGTILTAAVAVPTLAGDVIVYGAVQAELVSIDHQLAVSEDEVDLVDNARGRVGIKASEDLGNGWKGLARYEFEADTTDNTAGTDSSLNASLTARESMVGLKGRTVQIEVGNLRSAYKYTGGTRYDPFVATTLEARGNGGMSDPSDSRFGHRGFHKEAVGIKGGGGPVKARLTYGPSENDGSYTLSLKYNQGGVEAFVAIVDSGDLVSGGDKVNYSATKLGGAFKAGGHKVVLQYEMTDEGAKEPTYTFLGYNLRAGRNTFVIEFAMLDSDGGGRDTDMLVVGAIHKFSKTTRVFGGFRSSDADNNEQEDVITVGLRKDF
ncbi:MAG: porin [Gammaproteobacteria bacterium]|nr:porin [Gammaproteobacteria bacterium]